MSNITKYLYKKSTQEIKTTMNVITREDVVTVSESVAARNASVSHTIDFDTPCKYTYPDGSHCFVGAVAEGLGIPLPSTNSFVNQSSVPEYIDWLKTRGVAVNSSAADLLNDLQETADQGFYWEDVVSINV